VSRCPFWGEQLTPVEEIYTGGNVKIRIVSMGLAAAIGVGVGVPASAQSAGADQQLDEVVITGLFSATSVEKAPISVNVVTNAQLQEQVPSSAADLLKNVPGVYVNSGLGEIRNVVFSRGISANSLDGAGGYYYVSMQEDGLPTDLVTATNYGPDYFLRPDITLSSLEGLRGGTAAITGPNAPGGIFNYISKNGKTDPGMELQGKYGLEGNGHSPYYRADAYFGGKLTDSLYVSVGGFYRGSYGSHNPGYLTNKGGQIKANLLYEYDKGSVLVTVKALDDANDWNEFTPSLGGTRIAPGFQNTSSDLQPESGQHCYPKIDGGSGCWDPSNLVQSRSNTFGVDWKHDFSDQLHFENKARVSNNSTIWNTGAVISVVPLTDPIVNIIGGTAFLPGTFNYYVHGTGQLAYSMTSAGNAFVPGNYTTLVNNLPNQSLLANGVYSGFADASNYGSNQFVDQLQFTQKLVSHTVSLGGFAGLANLSNGSDAAGIGLMTLTNQPQMLDVTYTNPKGTVYNVTDPSGFINMGQICCDTYHGTQNQFSLFLGDNWKVSDQIAVDLGVRWEQIRYDIFNQSYTAPSGDPTATGGVDGNPLTLWDNAVGSYGPIYETKRNYSYFNYSGSVSFQATESLSTYIRYTAGKKAPDFGTIEGINTPGAIATEFPAPQQIDQLEIGLKHHSGGIDIQLFPFYSRLSNVTAGAFFVNNAGQFYAPPPIAGEIKTYGVEAAVNLKFSPAFAVHGNLTIQNPQASQFGSWQQGPKRDGTDDTLTITPDGDADNNPKLMGRAGVDWRPTSDLAVFGELSYIGKRAANAADAFYLPAYSSFDVGGSWTSQSNLKLQLNVNNLFNQVGIVSWSRTGFLASLDRQGLTKSQYDPNGIYPVVPIQARALYLTVSKKF